MLEQIQKYEQTFTKHMLLEGILASATLGALTLDHLVGANETHEYREIPVFHTDPKKLGKPVLGVITGCQVDGKLMYESLEPMAPNANMIVTDYQKQGFNIEAVCEGLASALRAARAEKPSFYCKSMGGMVLRHFAEYAKSTGLIDIMEGFGNVVMDASPYDADDIRLKYRGLLHISKTAQNSWFANHAKPKLMKDGHGWSKNTPLSALSGQGQFMLGEHPIIDLGSIAESVSYWQGTTPDHVINTSQALEKYQASSPKLRPFYDTYRPYGAHGASLEKLPDLIQQAIPQSATEPLLFPQPVHTLAA